MRVAGRAYLLTLCLLSSLWSGCKRQESDPFASRPQRPDVILILIDTLRADRVGAYGAKRDLTPALDAIAEQGVLFERAISQAPWTQPSMASLHTGRYPTVHGVGLKYFAAGGKESAQLAVLGAKWTTLAEALHQAGYNTAGFVANPWTLRSNGFAQGFDHYDDSSAGNDADGADLNEKIRAWLAGRDAQMPVFLFVHYMDVHGPYWAPPDLLEPLLARVEALPRRQKLFGPGQQPGYLAAATARYADRVRHAALADTKEYWIARYEAGVRYVDRHVAALRNILDNAGLWAGGLTVITADHGEELLDHALWNHGHTLYEEQLHVPLLIRWPGVLPAGRRVSERVQLIDVMPTVLELARVANPDGSQGASLLSLLRGEPWERPAFAEADKSGNLRVVYEGDHKLLAFLDSGRQVVYDLSADPRELDPTPADRADGGDVLVSYLEQLVAENKQLAGKQDVETIQLTDKQRRQLKGLGYTN